MAKLQIGDMAKLTGKYLRNTGQMTGREGQKLFKILGIQGSWAIVDEPADTSYFTPEEMRADPSLKYRRISLSALQKFPR